MAIYRDAIADRFDDAEITAEGERALAALGEALGLSADEAHSAREDAAARIYGIVLAKAFEDRKFTADERNHVASLAVALNLNAAQQAAIFRREALRAIQRTAEIALADGEFSTEDDEAVQAFADQLGVHPEFEDAQSQLIVRGRQLREIQRGNLPLEFTSLILQRGETCHFTAQTQLHEPRTVTRSYRYRGPSISIPIIKGVRYRLGQITVNRVTADTVVHLDDGTLNVTNKRIIFDGRRANVTMGLSSIVKFTVYSDGLQFQRSSGKDRYFTGTADFPLAGAILDRLLG